MARNSLSSPSPSPAVSAGAPGPAKLQNCLGGDASLHARLRSGGCYELLDSTGRVHASGLKCLCCGHCRLALLERRSTERSFVPGPGHSMEHSRPSHPGHLKAPSSKRRGDTWWCSAKTWAIAILILRTCTVMSGPSFFASFLSAPFPPFVGIPSPTTGDFLAVDRGCKSQLFQTSTSLEPSPEPRFGAGGGEEQEERGERKVPRHGQDADHQPERGKARGSFRASLRPPQERVCGLRLGG